MFRRRRQPPSAFDQVGLKNPLEAIPILQPNVEAREHNGRLQIRRTFEPRGRLYRLVSRTFGYEHFIQINLDEMGSRYWKLIDGQRNLDQIAREMARQEQQNLRESREAVVRFTKELMRRKMVGLGVRREEPVR